MSDQTVYVDIKDAAQLVGVHRETIAKRIADGELMAYQSGTDRRRRLIRREDVDRLRQPQSIDRTRQGAESVLAG